MDHTIRPEFLFSSHISSSNSHSLQIRFRFKPSNDELDDDDDTSPAAATRQYPATTGVNDVATGCLVVKKWVYSRFHS